MTTKLNKLFPSSLLVFTSFLALTEAQGQSLVVHQPVISGKGCHPGNTRAIVAPGGTAISILFDSFAVRAPKGRVSDRERTAFCNFHIPIQLEHGYFIQATDITYRGFAQLPQGVQARLSTVSTLPYDSAGYSFTGGQLLTTLSNMIDNFLIRQTLNWMPSIHPCPPMTSLGFSTVVELNGLGRKATDFPDTTEFVIDTADLAGAAEIHLDLKVVRCESVFGETGNYGGGH